MTLIAVHPGRLRDAAEQIERSTGLRVQIIGGSLVMSPTPRGKRAGAIRRLRGHLEPHLPPGLGTYEVSSVAMPDDEDDYATPDLVVLPVDWEEDDAWLADPRDAALAVEVISSSERARDIGNKTDWYATAGVALLLAVDPRHATWTLYSHPRDGAYQGVLKGAFGDEVPLPPPLPAALPTGDLPRY
ncbi:Uma2 family endonuclease [Kitasatospora sp. NPDC096147]|uniref:Uma2 family endonuclease n=1 Tax=Kitasatospora sp. NPDC096147 TaxID=3364093 RepID=UPI0037F7878C